MVRDQHGFGTGVTYVLLATLGWSLSGLFVRLMPGLNGWQLNCWRGFWMAVALLCYLIVRYGHDTARKFSSIPKIPLIVSAVCFALGTTFYVTSLTKVGTATVSVIGATSPLFTGLLSPWITGERPGLLAWISAVLALCGMTVIAWSGFEKGEVFGLLLCLGVPVMFALQTLLLRRYRSYDMMPAICVGGFLTFILAGFFSFYAGSDGNAFTIDMHATLLLMLMGPLQLSIPLIFYGMGARAVPAVTLALISMLDAVINPLWPWLIVGEVPERASFIGGGIILIAVLLSVVGGRLIAKPSLQR
jgi:drug/metabolite transporter (DMT)-like permease